MASVKVAILLEIDGAEADAMYVVDQLLDAGFFQDAVNEHDCDAGGLHVSSAIVRLVTDTEERGGKFQRLTVLKEGA